MNNVFRHASGNLTITAPTNYQFRRNDIKLKSVYYLPRNLSDAQLWYLCQFQKCGSDTIYLFIEYKDHTNMHTFTLHFVLHNHPIERQ